MGSIEEARDNFESLGFRNFKHTHYIAPQNDKVEIARIESDLVLMRKRTNHKEIVVLEALLEDQTIGIPETLGVLKAYGSFKGMNWKSDVVPYMSGLFTLEDSVYNLNFLARHPEEITDMKFFKAQVGINVLDNGKSDEGNELYEKFLRMALENSRSLEKVSDRIKMGRGHCKILIPNIGISGTDLPAIHAELLDAMGKLGWRDPKPYARKSS